MLTALEMTWLVGYLVRDKTQLSVINSWKTINFTKPFGERISVWSEGS